MAFNPLDPEEDFGETDEEYFGEKEWEEEEW